MAQAVRSIVPVSDTIAEHPLDEGLGELGLPLSDAQLALVENNSPWIPDAEGYLDYSLSAFEDERPANDDPQISPSEFTGFAFRMPHAGGWANFSFEGRSHLYQPYDTPARRILLFCGRQVEKSTLLGNKALGLCCLIPSYKILYVSPSATQTKVFSNDRIKDAIETSPVLKTFTTHMLSQNIFEKQFVNRSKITLRYAFLNADRTRGIPAHGLLLDEIQDILSDNIPVIEQCTSHSPEELKRFIYSGTPKSLDNVIEDYRARRSTQGEWVVPHDCKTGEGGRYWNILGEKNIGKRFLICEACGKRLDPMHKDSQWAWMVKPDPIHAPFESYRIPQLMVPWLDWRELIYNYEHYPRNKFYNECLGVSFDTGFRPLTLAQVRACCNASVHMGDVDRYRSLSYGQEVFAGIDWGSGENSYTVISLGTYINSKFRIFFVHRFTGEETEPEIQLNKIAEICTTFNVRLIGADYGGGFHPNSFLLRKFGPERVQKYQYVARLNQKLKWDGKLLRWMAHRTEVMSAVFNAIKRGTILEFPRWEEFKEPYGQDCLNIFSEYNEKLRMIQYDHSPGRTDDTFHSILYCFLVSMIIKPRPDIISPRREDPNVGTVWSSYTGPTNQG
jgi:hypothetical protein